MRNDPIFIVNTIAQAIYDKKGDEYLSARC